MADVFVSYSRRDKARVVQIVEALKGAGLSVWWDDDLPWGESYDDQIARALTEARTVLVVWSPQAVASEWVRDEATMARDLRKAFPVRIADVRPPLGHYRVQTLDLFDEPVNANPSWSRVIEGLTGRKSAHAPPPSSTRRGIVIRWQDLGPAALLLAGVVAGVVAVSGNDAASSAAAGGAADALAGQAATLAPMVVALLASFGFSAFRARG